MTGHGPADPFPFFVGCGRSGTTLLRAMFDSHPLMAVPSESYFVGNLGRHSSRYSVESGFDRSRFLDDLLGIEWAQQWGLQRAELQAAMDAAPPDDFAAAVRCVFRCYADKAGKPRYGDKTPNYVARMPLIAGLFPEARFVHIIRDGRDVATSFLRVPFGPETAAEGAIFWRRRVSNGRAAGRQLGPDRYREVRYEELVENPRGTLGQLCAFVRLNFDEAMLDYTARADELMSTGRPGAHVHLRLAPTKGLRDWRTEMSRAQVTRFELIAGDLLDELGYERATPRRRGAAGIRAGLTLAVRTGVNARQARRRLTAAAGSQLVT